MLAELWANKSRQLQSTALPGERQGRFTSSRGGTCGLQTPRRCLASGAAVPLVIRPHPFRRGYASRRRPRASRPPQLCNLRGDFSENPKQRWAGWGTPQACSSHPSSKGRGASGCRNCFPDPHRQCSETRSFTCAQLRKRGARGLRPRKGLSPSTES